MRNSLIWKLILGFLVVAIITAALVALFIRLTSIDRLTRLILDQQRAELQTSLANYYAEKGSWDGVQNDWQELRLRAFSTPPSDATHTPPGDRPSPNHERRRLFGLADAQGTVIVPVNSDYPAGSTAPASMLGNGTPVEFNGKTVGTILLTTQLPLLNPEESLFLQRTNQALIFAVFWAMLIALVIGILLARNIIRPIQALTLAAQNIAGGQLEQEVKVASKDELGRLAEAFNQMSREVARGNHLRRQMTADIAHDLRTPLTVIAGYVESMRDGVLQATPERLSLIYTEIERLQNLVSDLRMLTQVDAGELPLHPQPILPRILLERAAAPFSHHAEQQGVSLQVLADSTLPEVCVDEARMMQVFGNLISNSLRYTPSGGKITLSSSLANRQIQLSVADNGSGIPEEELPFIFDRFHRADESRHAEAGESGLGLAIVKALVEAHGGAVSAESKPGEGSVIHIFLPFE